VYSPDTVQIVTVSYKTIKSTASNQLVIIVAILREIILISSNYTDVLNEYALVTFIGLASRRDGTTKSIFILLCF
jgi:hypothetical protein